MSRSLLRSLRRRLPRTLLALFVVAWFATAGWNTGKPLPDGVHVRGATHAVPAADLRFLADVTTADAFGQRLADQRIFDAARRLIAESRDFLVLDMFLFNDDTGQAGADVLRPLSSEMRAALIERRRADPRMPILVIADPINTAYTGRLTPALRELTDAGIDVVITNLDPLRDSNPLWSGLWRIALRWWMRPSSPGAFDNPLDAGGPSVSAGAMARLLNFKANHRKVLLTRDARGELRGLVMSANAHDASSAHSNVAIEARGVALRPLLDSELAIAAMSGWRGDAAAFGADDATPDDAASVAAAPPGPAADPGTAWITVLTEGAIRDAVLLRLAEAGAGSAVDVAQFYLTQRGTIEALIAAAARGATVRVLLDPNKDAFGYEKSGLPNRQVASELLAASDGAIRVRWYRTHGEQFHAKLLAVHDARRSWFLVGSANFTRRNLDDYNLEAAIAVETLPGAQPSAGVQQWFDTLWFNRAAAGIEYTADAETYADPGQGRYWLYRFMEATGLSTF